MALTLMLATLVASTLKGPHDPAWFGSVEHVAVLTSLMPSGTRQSYEDRHPDPGTGFRRKRRTCGPGKAPC